MKPKTIGVIATIAIVTNILWIILMIAMEGDAPIFNTVADRISFIEAKAFLYRISYINAAFLTVIGTLFMTSLYLYSKKKYEFWSTIAFVFVPIYAVLNLFSYLSQIIIVPPLLALYSTPETKVLARLLHLKK